MNKPKTEFKVRLVSISRPTDGDALSNAEDLITYCARVSNPDNQTNTATAAKLLRYLKTNNHWSPFEMTHAVIEIETSRAISPQILRHRSFSFQEHSQRYQALDESGIAFYAARRQDRKNRQNSIDDLPEKVRTEWEARQLENWKMSFDHYKWALDNDIAKECARFVLPLGTKTRLYMAGNLRSWMHYIDVRTDPSTQKEHRDIAIACLEVLKPHFPNALGDEDV
jgi:thymidylate synthase (FAD)